MATTLGDICPVCKLRNRPGAMICEFCGAPLISGHPHETRSTNRLDDEAPRDIQRAAEQKNLIPEAGLGLYLANNTRVAIVEKETTLGRRAEGGEDWITDLIPFDGYDLGVSRQHAKIRRTRSGYEIIDLKSTNGTWVNQKKLFPDEPHPLKNGDIIHLGRLSMVVFYKENKK